MGASLSGMGETHEKRLSKAQARALCGMYPLPDVGREIVVAFKRDPTYSAFPHRLMVGNYGGVFVATSCGVARDSWAHIFGVNIK